MFVLKIYYVLKIFKKGKVISANVLKIGDTASRLKRFSISRCLKLTALYIKILTLSCGF